MSLQKRPQPSLDKENDPTDMEDIACAGPVPAAKKPMVTVQADQSAKPGQITKHLAKNDYRGSRRAPEPAVLLEKTWREVLGPPPERGMTKASVLQFILVIVCCKGHLAGIVKFAFPGMF